MRMLRCLLLLGLCSGLANLVPGQDAAKPLTAESLRELALRPLGPGIVSGRVGDIAVDPKNRSVWYVAVASGGVWKTTNRGLSWTPLFDKEGSYSIGCVTLDPKDSAVVWVGTGENQSQRSVGFGDGVYKSVDGGKTWKNMGLRESEHIAKIIVDPRNSEVVYVAAQGPLWKEGGDRGLYKTSDGGKTWQAILTVSENTGITDVVMDPRNPDLLYAASYQRRRHVGQLIGGGPEAAIYKSEDGGGKWGVVMEGLPKGDRGRIALALSPQKADVVYAHISAGKETGFYRSSDGAKTWERRSGFKVQDGQYYGELFPDPHTFDKLYAVNLNMAITEDGGKTFTAQRWPIHVDYHALVLDPTDPAHLLVGNDGGLYESPDAGKSWRHFGNLPVSQFYRITTGGTGPFYRVYGGTQDNGTFGGPVRTRSKVGIRNSDWEIVGGGDGMQVRVDPTDPNILYTTLQYGSIARLDKRIGFGTPIRPKVDKADKVRWNWDTPLLISPHSPTRLYYAASRLYRSDNRGDAWKVISPDLTRQLDRDKLPVMGKLWGADAVSKNTFTTDLGVATALDESPIKEGLLIVGTDDGLIQISEDAGKEWRKVEKFPGIPDMAYVSDVVASQHDAEVMYATFNHYLRGDYKPYVMRSGDKGKTWASIAGDLPERHPVWCLVEDPGSKHVLYAGTEFGLFVTLDGGKHWHQLANGLPTVAVRDLAYQRDMGDLVVGTFGRGIFVLDDVTALRHLTPETLAAEATLLPPRKAHLIREVPFARTAEGNPATPNPSPGVTFSVHVRDKIEGDAKLEASIADSEGKAVRKLTVPTTAGLHRVAWDLRSSGMGARPVPAGKYKVTLNKVGAETKALGEVRELEVVAVEVP